MQNIMITKTCIPHLTINHSIFVNILTFIFPSSSSLLTLLVSELISDIMDKNHYYFK